MELPRELPNIHEWYLPYQDTRVRVVNLQAADPVSARDFKSKLSLTHNVLSFCHCDGCGFLSHRQRRAADRGSQGAGNCNRSVNGIGRWTADYIALRGLGEPDAFPSGDIVLRRACSQGNKLMTASALEQRAEAWRPWRGYAAIYLWSERVAPLEKLLAS